MQQCGVRCETDTDLVTIRQEESDHKDEREQRSERTHFSLPSITGMLLGASALNVTEDDKEEGGSSLSSRLTLKAAEKVDDEKGDLTKLKNKSRRTQFNFIADLVEETAPGLVYIEIKVPNIPIYFPHPSFQDGGMRDYYTGQPVTVSNGSGFIVESDGLILTNAHVVINKPRASIQVRHSHRFINKF